MSNPNLNARREMDLEAVVSEVVDGRNVNNITPQVKQELKFDLLAALNRFKKKQGFSWELEARPGSIAFCKRGDLGLILNIPRPGNLNWTGIKLAKKQFGQPWQSQSPQVVAYIDRFVEDIEGTMSAVDLGGKSDA